MSIVGLGTATFIPGYGLAVTGVPPAEQIIAVALARGVSYIDTAHGYAQAERTLGGAAGEIARRGTRVATKIAPEPDVSAAGIVRMTAASLDRLRLSRVDSMLLHTASARHLTGAGLSEGLREVRGRGLAARIGASTYGVDAAVLALEQDWCDVLQVEHSILNQSVVAALRPRKRAGQEIVARSILCKGLLTRRHTHAAELPKDVTDALGRVAALAREWDMTVPALAVRFALDTPGVDVAIVGVSSVEELDEALGAAARPSLTAAQLAELATLDRSPLDAVHPERWPSVAR